MKIDAPDPGDCLPALELMDLVDHIEVRILAVDKASSTDCATWADAVAKRGLHVTLGNVSWTEASGSGTARSDATVAID